MRHLQNAEVFLVTTDDLNAYRKSFGCEACGHRSCWISGRRDVPAGLHPIDVISELYSGDFGWVWDIDIEWRQLRRRENKEFVLFEECLKASPKLGMSGFGVRKIYGCQSQPFLDFTFQRVLERVGMLLQSYTIGICTIPCTKEAEGNLGGGKVRLRLLDDAADGFKCFGMSIYYRADARIEGHTAKVLEPSHAHALEAAVERAREAFTRLVDGKRCPGIRSSDRAQSEGKVCHRAPQASGSIKRRPRERRFRIWYSPDRGPEPHNIAEGRRIAQRTTGIGAGGNWCESTCKCDGGSTRGPTAGLGQIVRIVSCAEDFIKRLRACAKFWRVGLADGNRSRTPHAFDNNIVF